MTRGTDARGGLPAHRREGRGQSSVLGVALLFGVVIAGSVSIVVLGATALNDTEDQLSVQRAQKVLTQFDSDAALVALGNTDIQSVSFGDVRADDFETHNGTGWMRITVENQTGMSTTTVLNQTLGSITYEGTDVTLAYQGGGVWKQSGDGSVMVSPPEFHFRNGTLTLPVVNVTGAPTLDGQASVSHTETTKKFPDPAAGNENPLANHEVTVTVKNDYYEGWGRYFEERTDGEVTYDHSRNVTNLTLVSPIGKKRVEGALSASASGLIDLSGGGDDPCTPGIGGLRRYTDSYNSSQGDYCSTRSGSQGNITYAGDVSLGGTSDVKGSVRSGGEITISGNAEITGDAYHVDGCTGCTQGVTGNVGGDIENSDEVSTPLPIDRLVSRTVDDIENDHDTAPDIDSATDTLDYSGGTATLPAGTYYLSEIDPAGSETIRFDTSGGDVTVAVENYIDLGGNGQSNTVDVIGDGEVNVYVEGASQVPGRQDTLYMSQNDAIVTGDKDSTQFKLYGKREFNATLESSGNNRAEFVGILYAPAGSGGSGSVTIDQGNFWGGVLTGDVTVANGGLLSYDLALRNEQAVSRNAKVIKITYLHITVNRIHVD